MVLIASDFRMFQVAQRCKESLPALPYTAGLQYWSFYRQSCGSCFSLFLASSFSLSPCFIVFVGFPMCLKLRLCDCVFGITFCYEWSEGSIKDSLFDYGIFHGGPLVLTCMSPELKCLDRVHWGPSLRLALKLPPPHSHRR